MTTVNVTTTENKVEVIDAVNNVLEIDTSTTNVVEVNVAGPQGATGPAGTGIDTSNAVDDSLLYFDASSGTLKLDNTTTKLSLVFGGSF